MPGYDDAELRALVRHLETTKPGLIAGVKAAFKKSRLFTGPKAKRAAG
jgi:hypothetical protein